MQPTNQRHLRASTIRCSKNFVKAQVTICLLGGRFDARIKKCTTLFILGMAEEDFALPAAKRQKLEDGILRPTESRLFAPFRVSLIAAYRMTEQTDSSIDCRTGIANHCTLYLRPSGQDYISNHDFCRSNSTDL